VKDKIDPFKELNDPRNRLNLSDLEKGEEELEVLLGILYGGEK